jgi:glutaminase
MPHIHVHLYVTINILFVLAVSEKNIYKARNTTMVVFLPDLDEMGNCCRESHMLENLGT